MRFQRILQAVQFQPWFITADGYATVKQVVDMVIARPELGSAMDDGSGGHPRMAGPFSFFVNDRPEMTIDRNGIATIHVVGVTGQKLSMMEKSCGNTGYEQIIEEIRTAEVQGAKGALFLYDSPGGAAIGCGDAALAISQMSIPTAAWTDSVMCSAAYYGAAGCDFVASSESAIVGSIGTILPWIDKTKMWSLLGLEFDPIVNEGADLKDSMHGPSLNDEHREFLQQHINDLASQFQTHVSDHRELDSEVYRAGFYIGTRAADMNLVDDVGGVEVARNWLLSQIGS